MAKRDQNRSTPKKNLCVVRYSGTSKPPTTSCKKIGPVKTVADAKQIAYRLTRKLSLPVGASIMITLGERNDGLNYWFHVQHGRVTCRKGSMFGPKCG